MGVEVDKIRAAADRVAASHGLEVVEVEYAGAGKQRALRVFVEKDAAGRAALKAAAASSEVEGLPSGVPVEALSGVTHEDCAVFATDFGVLVDVEDLVPGSAEYTLEVSSPGIERKLYSAKDYERFSGFLVELKTFAPVNGSKKLVGRMSFMDGTVTLDLSAVKKSRKGVAVKPELVSVALMDVEKANLVAEI